MSDPTTPMSRTKKILLGLGGLVALVGLIMLVVWLMKDDAPMKKAKNATYKAKSALTTAFNGKSTADKNTKAITDLTTSTKNLATTSGNNTASIAALTKAVDGVKTVATSAQNTANGAFAFSAENRAKICEIHKWRKDMKDFCKGVKPLKKKDPKKSGTSGSGNRWRSPKWGRGKPAPAAVASTDPNLEKRVAALEKNDKRQDEVLEPLYKAQDHYGPKYKARVLAALGIGDNAVAPKVQAHSK